MSARQRAVAAAQERRRRELDAITSILPRRGPSKLKGRRRHFPAGKAPSDLHIGAQDEYSHNRVPAGVPGMLQAGGLIQTSINVGKEMAHLRATGRKPRISTVCGPLGAKVKGPGYAARFYAQYRVLKYALACAKREGRHQGFIRKNWSAQTRANRLYAARAKIQAKLDKLGITPEKERVEYIPRHRAPRQGPRPMEQ